MKRESLAFWAFTAAGFAQLGLLVAIGDSTFNAVGLIPLLLMLIWLWRRSRTAWWIFLIANCIGFLATAALLLASLTNGSTGAHTLWADTLTVLLGSGILISILLSAPMRARTRPPASI